MMAMRRMSRVGGRIAMGKRTHISSSKGYFSEKERALENKYFNEKDRDLLTKLLEKMKVHTEAEHHEYHAETLDEIFAHHGIEVTPELRKDLTTWKTGHHESS